ncbi:hypothetical protein BM43_7621 (plasmid) [Burkholderia gladioli]|nr:hypothetical protein BM43_7621 [Burkholderia gladioli]
MKVRREKDVLPPLRALMRADKSCYRGPKIVNILWGNNSKVCCSREATHNTNQEYYEGHLASPDGCFFSKRIG